MTWHLDLWNDRDVPARRVRHDVFNLVLRIEAASSRAIRFLAPSADLREIWERLYLDAPALVIGEMPVHHVEFVKRHNVEETLHKFGAEKMAPFVEHHASP